MIGDESVLVEKIKTFAKLFELCLTPGRLLRRGNFTGWDGVLLYIQQLAL